ncbi:hypothetical protein D6T64_21280 [Cryobacterium melibiosiphilum]|uniref:WxL domain-containing protein n=1 Tax=Cryobacterium melibiosiphilum TaxID=995039 RepID=A0A3A5M7H5_9MICO|nr:hypothetical protein [Cryobacterium melibiosiphilum]RJT84685.1 hypothetical protein D6T64_21280 [Cryobacterium melibiosiphilum]
MRKSTFAALALMGSVALVGAAVTPAMAATTDTTIATVAVTGGVLTMVAPETAALTAIVSSSAPQTASAELTGVQVIDDRASIAIWTATATLSAFVPTNGSTTVIPLTTATYVPDAAVVTVSPTTVVTPSSVTDLTDPETVQVSAGGTSSNTATWGAKVEVTVPALALADIYTATLTHSVS